MRGVRTEARRCGRRRRGLARRWVLEDGQAGRVRPSAAVSQQASQLPAGLARQADNSRGPGRSSPAGPKSPRLPPFPPSRTSTCCTHLDVGRPPRLVLLQQLDLLSCQGHGAHPRQRLLVHLQGRAGAGQEKGRGGMPACVSKVASLRAAAVACSGGGACSCRGQSCQQGDPSPAARLPACLDARLPSPPWP